MMFKIRERVLAGVIAPPTANEMRKARVAAARSRIDLETYTRAAASLSDAAMRQQKVIENNHLAPSFAAALGRKRP